MNPATSLTALSLVVASHFLEIASLQIAPRLVDYLTWL